MSGLRRALVALRHVQAHEALEAAGLVRGTLELSEDGKAMKFFEPIPFRIELTPEAIAPLYELTKNYIARSIDLESWLR